MSNLDFNMHNVRYQYRYSVFEHKLITSDNLVFSRSLIVIKNNYDVIVHFTKLHKYVSDKSKYTRMMTSDSKARMYYVCSMLNYIFVEKSHVFKANHIFQINEVMLESFFSDYALTKKKNGKYRSQQSVERCILSIMNFFQNLNIKFKGYLTIKPSKFYDKKTSITSHGKMLTKYTPRFKPRVMPQYNKIFRDIPTKILEELINLAFIYAKDIAFALCLQIFAGLRPGEVCSIRQDKSPLGCSIIQTVEDNNVKKIEIDLTQEYILRSDGVICGKIKKERIQRVHPAFMDAFDKAYKFHKRFIQTQKYEKAYCPMFVNSKGTALTYHNYRVKFSNLVINHLRPLLIKHENTEYRLYGQLLYEHSLGLHVLRHWFSVQLVLMGEDIAQIQYWRGDLDPQSAFSYLQNKGDLINELSYVNNQFSKLIINWEDCNG